jgi:hypothetical protein
MRELMASICDDIHYQSRLRADFRRRRVHPTIEALVWHHVVGKPAERVQLSGDVAMNQQLGQERELFAQLSVEDLQELAKDSERLLVKARAMAQRQRVPPARATLPGPAMDNGEIPTGESTENTGIVDDV